MGSLAGQLLLLPLQPPGRWRVPTGHQNFVDQGPPLLLLWWSWEWSSNESSPAPRCLLPEACRTSPKQAESNPPPLQIDRPHSLICGLGLCMSAFLASQSELDSMPPQSSPLPRVPSSIPGTKWQPLGRRGNVSCPLGELLNLCTCKMRLIITVLQELNGIVGGRCCISPSPLARPLGSLVNRDSVGS